MTEEGRRLLAAHTWHVWNRGIGWSIHVGPEVDPRGHEHCRDLMDADILGKGVFDEDDAALIVAAVNQYAALLDVVDAARAVLDHPAGLGLAALLAYDRESSNRLRAALAAIPPSRDSTPDPLE